jgi:hypothetical protein
MAQRSRPSEHQSIAKKMQPNRNSSVSIVHDSVARQIEDYVFRKVCPPF